MPKDETGERNKSRIMSWHTLSRLAITILISLFFIAFVVVGPSAIGWLSYFLSTGSIGGCAEILSTSPQDAESFAHIKLPSSTTNVTMYDQEGCRSPRHFFVRFQVNPSDLNTFIASTRVPSINSPTIIPTIFGLIPDRLDWHLDRVKFSLIGSSPNSIDYQQTIGIDAENPNQYTVYVAVTSYD